MKIFICKTCGHIEFNSLPDKCPVCFSEKEKFSQNDNIFTESSAKSPEAAVKHIPAVAVNKQCGLIPETPCLDVHVRIGKTLHPMEEKHFIQFIDCYQDDKYVSRVMLTPMTINPAACFHLKNAAGKITIVENCNIHGY
jgi:superoxide reductase